MVKHVILWKLKDMSEAEYNTVITEMKTNLEALVGQVPGLIDLKVYTTKLPTSNVDVMLDSTLESAEALKGYAAHPAHVFAADTYVRPFTATRSCLDFEI
jgi:hypothetical protein